ncbi:hypothetical protein BDN70DRAFT_48640 [Pholiota conissans]|uniref:Uncharacterized protein n=1 Tax=Pholiota conissans TaxID=109636 RepID=A0A9P5Z039_9AGAR|nr:hypothetical protein BDN70DRAFT_48640 [Pholiota conissans]
MDDFQVFWHADMVDGMCTTSFSIVVLPYSLHSNPSHPCTHPLTTHTRTISNTCICQYNLTYSMPQYMTFLESEHSSSSCLNVPSFLPQIDCVHHTRSTNGFSSPQGLVTRTTAHTPSKHCPEVIAQVRRNTDDKERGQGCGQTFIIPMMARPLHTI